MKRGLLTTTLVATSFTLGEEAEGIALVAAELLGGVNPDVGEGEVSPHSNAPLADSTDIHIRPPAEVMEIRSSTETSEITVQEGIEVTHESIHKIIRLKKDIRMEAGMTSI